MMDGNGKLALAILTKARPEKSKSPMDLLDKLPMDLLDKLHGDDSEPDVAESDSESPDEVGQEAGMAEFILALKDGNSENAALAFKHLLEIYGAI